MTCTNPSYSRLTSYAIFACCLLSLLSCKKYLDDKPRSDIAIPASVSDLQAVLDNRSFNANSPSFPEFVSDNLYLTDAGWGSAELEERTNYLWAANAPTPANSNWIECYNSIYQSNFVLDALPNIQFDASEINACNNVKGTALFYRSFMFHQLAQLFCKPYLPSSFNDLGIILRVKADINSPVMRANVQQTYDRIIDDLKEAARLLPVTSLNKLRPNKPAAYGALARVYLSMNDYTNAGKYADSSLLLSHELLDYAALTDIPAFFNNPEILFFSHQAFYPSITGNNAACFVDSMLYLQYGSNDKRKTLFFSGSGNRHYWRGSYARPYEVFLVFDGIATDEVYITRAECRARDGDKDGALSDLNTVLRKRHDPSFADITATDAADALNKVLIERRKELVFRGLRWSDLRRFNAAGANVTIYRKINGTTYSLPPNDLRWVLQIPDIEISRSGIAQNPR